MKERNSSRLTSIGVLSLALLLSSCSVSPGPLAARQSTDTAPVATGTPDGAALAKAQGTVRLFIRWPERADYAAQAIPRRTNSMRIEVLDGDDNALTSSHITRPQGGSLDTAVDLTVEAASNRRIRVLAYQEQVPGFDAVPIAQGLTSNVSIAPSTDTTVTVKLIPATQPIIDTMPDNGGPLSFITLTGSHFEGWGGPVEVRFNGLPAAYVDATSTQILALVPAGAVDGPISVEADGITTTSSASFRVIRTLTLSPTSVSMQVGAAVPFAFEARSSSGATIPSPVITSWSFQKLDGSVLPGQPLEPPSSLTEGTFTAGSTGSFEIKVNAGSTQGTASVTVI